MASSELLAAIRTALAGRYELAEEIGRGGMATVYRAIDLRYQRPVAIKVLHPDLARAVAGERFLREIQILARLSHPNILPLLDSGATEVVAGLEVPWYVMPFVPEMTLRARLRTEGALPIEEALRLTRELCAALTHAHSQGLIHRDIKPENVLLQGGQAVLADFGIARAVTMAGGGSISSTGLVVGTPAYMSPEQATGSDKLDARTDIYSLGCVLYEMLAGQPPFMGTTPQAVLALHQFEPPTPIRVLRPTTPEPIEAVLDCALAKNPADRFPGAGAFAHALETLIAPTSSAPWRRKPRSVGRWAWAGLSLLAVAAIVYLALTFLRDDDLDHDRLVVLPFHHVEPHTEALITGVNCELLVYHALDGFEDLKRVDRMVVGSALERDGVPATLDATRSLARRLRAGRFIWGEVWREGDSLRVRGVLFDTRRSDPLYRTTITLPADLARAGSGPVARAFGLLALRLVLGGRVDEIPEVSWVTSSFAALTSALGGDSALAGWNLSLAQQRYQAALKADPTYPMANLRLAEVSRWMDLPADQSRPYLQIALRQSGRLPPGDRELANAMLALVNEDYPEACDRYQAILERDRNQIAALIGLGDCLMADNAVLPDSSSPSGWRFRSSVQEAARAYLLAFRLAPATHRAYDELVRSRLFSVSFTNNAQTRIGRALDSASLVFLATPALRGDSLALVPYPVRSAQGITPENPPSDPAALQLGVRQVRELASSWNVNYPESPRAWSALASVREILGEAADSTDAGPLALLRRARALNRDSVYGEFLQVSMVRLLLKAGQYAGAARLADTLLSSAASVRGQRALRLAPLATLRGNPALAAALLARAEDAYELAGPDGRPADLPSAIRSTAAKLYAYAVLPASGDSVRIIEERLQRQVELWTADEGERSGLLGSLMLLPGVLAFPENGVRPAHSRAPTWYLPELQAALVRGDTARVRQGLAEIERSPGRMQARSGELAPEIIYQEAWLHLAIGDTAQAVTALERLLGGLTTSTRSDLLLQCQSPAGLIRAMRLLADLDPRQARWRAASRALTGA